MSVLKLFLKPFNNQRFVFWTYSRKKFDRSREIWFRF